MKNIFKNLFSKDNLFYSVVFIFGITIIIINRIFVGFNNNLWFVDFASMFGLLNMIYRAKHSIWGIIFCLLSSILLLFSDIIQHLWLNACICAFISLPNLTIGIFSWRKNEKKDSNNNLKSLSKKNLSLTVVLYACLSLCFGVILYFLNGNLYYLDSIYSAGCAIGVVLCSFAYIDQFYFFIFADIVGTIMYTMLSLQNLNNLPMIFTNVIYIVVNIKGLINWKRLMKEKKDFNFLKSFYFPFCIFQ